MDADAGSGDPLAVVAVAVVMTGMRVVRVGFFDRG